MNGKVFINSICGRCVHIDVCDSHKDNRLKCGCFLEERPHGEWIDTGEMEEYWAEEYKCSLCGVLSHAHNYCPNCGAKMEAGEEK